MKKATIYLGLTAFSIYWFATFFFTFPENYLQIKAMSYEKLFSTFFYQKWSFFAPPPQTNDRLYYEFVNQKDTISIEVLKPLNDKRKKEYIFNADSSVIDYVLSGCINGITDNLREDYNIYKFENCKSESELECHAEFIKKNTLKIQNLTETKTLLNYGLIVANKKINLEKYYKVKFILTSVAIPKFSSRLDKNQTLSESQMYQSSYYNYKLKKWEK
jgi:hypothetical protein